MSEENTVPAQEELVITRTFNAPRELVFKAWTEAERLARWWGPKGCTIKVHKFEPRPGGAFHYCMEMPGGNNMWGKFVYREITPPERIVWVNSFADEAGNIARAPFFDGGWPLEVLNNVTFTEQAGKTTLNLRAGPINATEAERKLFVEMRGSMQQGFGGSFDQLDAYLEQAQS